MLRKNTSKFILFLLINSCFYGCGSSADTTYHQNGSIKKSCQKIEKNKMVCTEYYLSGSKRIVANMLNNKQDGITLTYYENGSLEREAYFKQGVQQDSLKIYYPNGKLMEKSFIKDGDKYGEIISYREDGSIKSQAQINQGLFNGPSNYFNKNGKLSHTIQFNKGEPADWISRRILTSINISFPKNWIVIHPESEDVLFSIADTSSTEGFTTNANIVKLKKNASITQALETLIKDLKTSFPSMKITQKLDDQISYTIQKKYTSTMAISKIVLCDGDHYLFSALTSIQDFDYNDPIFNLMATSFLCLKKTN